MPIQPLSDSIAGVKSAIDASLLRRSSMTVADYAKILFLGTIGIGVSAALFYLLHHTFTGALSVLDILQKGDFFLGSFETKRAFASS